MAKTDIKQCSKCKIAKQERAFSLASRELLIRHSWCKSCMNEYARSRNRTKDPLLQRKHNLKKKYGMTLEDYDQMLHNQGGSCKVCNGPPMGIGRYHVDHCHDTGTIRGLLCHKCNVALGMVGDDPLRLHALIQYLAENA